jgi:hypothetical protein
MGSFLAGLRKKAAIRSKSVAGSEEHIRLERLAVPAQRRQAQRNASGFRPHFIKARATAGLLSWSPQAMEKEPKMSRFCLISSLF